MQLENRPLGGRNSWETLWKTYNETLQRLPSGENKDKIEEIIYKRKGEHT